MINVLNQTKNTNCRSIATYCAIELYLLNDPCALFKRMDILLGNPKTVLIQSIISTNYISDLYGERLKEKKEEKNKQELPKR